MIPKKIHYIWFGKDEYPEVVRQCIDSWHNVMPDYEYKLWNEENYDINKNIYVKQAYEAKKWAFVSDYVRLEVLYKEGGIYLDTDVKVFKRFDTFLHYKGFTGVEGKNGMINPGLVFGAQKELKVVKEILETYNQPFICEDGSFDYTTIVKRATDVLKKYGYQLNGKRQNIADIEIFEKCYFAPELKKVKRGTVGKNTYTAHLYMASWVDPQVKKRMRKWYWRIIHMIGVKTAGIMRKAVGEKRWIFLRTKLFKKIYDKTRTY